MKEMIVLPTQTDGTTWINGAIRRQACNIVMPLGNSFNRRYYFFSRWQYPRRKNPGRDKIHCGRYDPLGFRHRFADKILHQHHQGKYIFAWGAEIKTIVSSTVFQESLLEVATGRELLKNYLV